MTHRGADYLVQVHATKTLLYKKNHTAKYKLKKTAVIIFMTLKHKSGKIMNENYQYTFEVLPQSVWVCGLF